MSHRSLCVSVDLDGFGCYAAIHGRPAPEQGHDPLLRAALPRMLELFAELGVPATLFCVGADLVDGEVAHMIGDASGAGHEIGNHSYSHWYDLRARGADAIERDIARCEDAVERATGRRPVGFRTPGYNVSPVITEVVGRRGYLYDSSMLPCPPYYLAKGAVMALMRLRGLRSRSQMTPPQTLTSPLRPYRASASAPWRRQEGGLWEVPMCVLPGVRFPVIGTTLALVGERGFAAMMPWIERAHPDLVNLELHAIDFVDRSDSPELASLADAQVDLRRSASRKIRTYRSVFGRLSSSGSFRTLESAVGLL